MLSNLKHLIRGQDERVETVHAAVDDDVGGDLRDELKRLRAENDALRALVRFADTKNP